MNLVVGDNIYLDIRKQGINGEGIGYYNKTLVFVPGAILKETVNAEIIFVTKNYAIAKIVKISRVSTKRVNPPCKYYEECGGCHMQHIEYTEQLKIKQSIIKQALKKYTNLNVDKLEIDKTKGMKSEYHYRNKSQMPFKNTNFGLALGFYKPDSNHFVFVEECIVHHDMVNKINQNVLRIMRKHKCTAFDKRNTEGIFLFLVTRYFETTNQGSITFVVTKYDEKLMSLAKDIQEQLPYVVSISYSINDITSNLVLTDKATMILGEQWIETKFRDYQVKVSPDAFHQLNTLQMETMYDLMLKTVDLNEKTVVFDLYSGIGITSLLFASHVKRVYGIDYSYASVNDAKNNAKINKVNNIEFLTGHVESEMPKLVKNGIKPDLVVMDPPRKGLAKPVIDALLKSLPKQILYVSCNPSTLAKNLNELNEKYRIVKIIPIDMFPNTASVESMTLLKLK